ncbi:LysR family transcriptional regulator [Marinomonas transparens]|uniref:LysR family transcriptional regulator n=1 Tax=Marinomonas transparens TaxID=2795388 RepID=A0A934JWZ0_9GAMM|nr:LysR family transcriptional regulator [Marinomonas transparens]MBJ7538744.1 LysR family transcriptional regulator [Marinomonas transparens]
MLTSQDIEFFVSLAQSKSLAATARKLNVTPPSVSQRLQALEQKLNVKLVERGSRAISLTLEGNVLFQEGLAVLRQIELLEDKVAEKKQAISGKIRVVAPVGYGTERVSPLVAEFHKIHPLTHIELILSDTPNWSPIDPPDVVIYIGPLKDSSLKRIILQKNRRLLLASPHYLQNAEPIHTPQDLLNHQCLVIRENDDDVTMWKLTHQTTGESSNVRIKASLMSNVGPVVKDWAVNGYGIMQRSEWNVANELKDNTLQVVLPEYSFPSANIVALVSSTRDKRPAKINAFLDYIKEHLSEEALD